MTVQNEPDASDGTLIDAARAQAGAERDPAIDGHGKSAEMTPNNTDEYASRTTHE